MAISLPPKGSDAKKLGAYFTPLKVEAQSAPNMTVKVAEGSFWTEANEHMEYIGGTSPTISAPSADAKWVLVTVTNTGMLNIVNGAASGTPVLPAPSSYKDELPLAAIFIGDTTTAITNDMIYDLRPMWSIPPDSVSQTQLNDFATVTYVDNGLNTKADTTGTASPNFTLNVGGASINDSGIYVDRFSGPDVAIRFNETAVTGSPPVANPSWEFTNDGVTWNPIGVASGSYYTKSDLNGGALDFLYYTKNDLSTTGVLDGRYYEQSVADATFSVIGHTHVAGDIAGLGDPVETINSITPTLGDVQLGLNELNDVTNSLPGESQVIVYRSGAYINEQLNTDDLLDVDTSSTPPVLGDVLVHNGGGGFVNRQLVKNDISDFTGAEFVLTTNLDGDPYNPSDPTTWVDQDIYGVKTFKDGAIIETSLVITGAHTHIQTADLQVTDPYVDINFGETGNGVGNGSGVSGIRIDRGPAGSPANPPAIIQWDEAAGQWEFGVEGSANPILGGAHTHTAAQVTDFAPAVTAELNVNALNTILDVTYPTTPFAGDYLRYGVASWENKNFATDVTAELNSNNLNQLQDVVYLGSPALTSGDFLQWNGAAWENHVFVKADISDFLETDYLHTTGNESKTGDLDITGDFTVNFNGAGSKTFIDSEFLEIRDNTIRINTGEAGVGVSGGVAGIEIDRGPSATNAQLWWSEPAGTWLAHRSLIAGSPPSPGLTSAEISFVGHQHVVSDIVDLSVTASEINTLTGITGNVQTQLGDKISRTGDAMDNGANLTFAVNGEVLGLPATPSVGDAATSKTYVDTQDTAISLSLSTHISDLTLHVTANQNTFLDALNLPTLLASEVNELVGVTSNVQTQLDSKTVKTIPATVGNLAGLNGTGDLTDSGLILNDTGTLVSEIWSAAKIDTTKSDKVSGATLNDFATLDASGNLLDSGLILNDSGTANTDIWSASQIDTVKADKVTGATVGNFAGLDGAGNLTDSGVNNSTFAAASHTHPSTEITDYATRFTSELGLNNLQDIGDVTNAALTAGDLLQWTGLIWDNVPTTSITGFVHATGNVNEAIDGQKTFANNTAFQSAVTITGALTSNGTTNINGDLTASGLVKIADEIVVLNSGSTSAPTADGGGIILDRDVGTPLPAALLTWHHADSRWQAGLSGAVEHVALENVTVAQPEYELVVGTGGAVYNLGFGVSAPPAGRTGIQVFVNGIKQIEGATKAYTVSYANPSSTVITFNAGSEPAALDDVEFYGFGFIG